MAATPPMPIELYHVTSIQIEQTEPEWREIRVSVANDIDWDGSMFGLPVACMTSTRYQGGLPTLSPYPRSGIDGQEYWRVRETIDVSQYDFFCMHNHINQRHFLVLSRNNPSAKEIQVKTILEARGFVPNGDEFIESFPNNQANSYPGGMWINVNFLEPVFLRNPTWDSVQYYGANTTVTSPTYRPEIRFWASSLGKTKEEIQAGLFIPELD